MTLMITWKMGKYESEGRPPMLYGDSDDGGVGTFHVQSLPGKR